MWTLLALVFVLACAQHPCLRAPIRPFSDAPRAVQQATRDQVYHNRVASHYTKYLDANGLSVCARGASPASMYRAGYIANMMLRKRPDIRRRLIDEGIKIVVLGSNEQTTSFPEYADLNTAAEGEHADYDTRVRGLGATWSRPASSASEENLLCRPNHHLARTNPSMGDRYQGESIMIHEFAHTMLSTFTRDSDRILLTPGGRMKLVDAVQAAYARATRATKWVGTYAGKDWKEYWAVGAQIWHSAGQHRVVANNWNHVWNRTALLQYDPELYQILDQVFCNDNWIAPQASCGPDTMTCDFSSCGSSRSSNPVDGGVQNAPRVSQNPPRFQRESSARFRRN